MVRLPKTTRKGVYENIQSRKKKNGFLTHSSPSRIKDWRQNTSAGMLTCFAHSLWPLESCLVLWAPLACYGNIWRGNELALQKDERILIMIEIYIYFSEQKYDDAVNQT